MHRLDRDTSGVLLVAKKRSALTALHAQLRDGEVDKRYLALVRGPWRDAKKTVDVPLHKFSTPEGERRVRVEDAGRPSTTTFRRQKTWPKHDPPLALVEAELETGRTHQIRVHLAHVGHALAGDDKYGDFAWNRLLAKEGLKRMFLHARSMTFSHPVTREAVTVESPLPPELERYLAMLDGSDCSAPGARNWLTTSHASRWAGVRPIVTGFGRIPARDAHRDRFLAVKHAELVHDVAEVEVGGARLDAELERDVAARHAVGRHLQALPSRADSGTTRIISDGS